MHVRTCSIAAHARMHTCTCTYAYMHACAYACTRMYARMRMHMLNRRVLLSHKRQRRLHSLLRDLRDGEGGGEGEGEGEGEGDR